MQWTFKAHLQSENIIYNVIRVTCSVFWVGLCLLVYFYLHFVYYCLYLCSLPMCILVNKAVYDTKIQMPRAVTNIVFWSSNCAKLWTLAEQACVFYNIWKKTVGDEGKPWMTAQPERSTALGYCSFAYRTSRPVTDIACPDASNTMHCRLISAEICRAPRLL